MSMSLFPNRNLKERIREYDDEVLTLVETSRAAMKRNRVEYRVFA